MAISSVTNAGNSMWQQIQTQQAQREADRAERAARALQSQAKDARTAASRAQEKAMQLEARASQAENAATRASQHVQTSRSLGEAKAKLGELYSNLPKLAEQRSSHSIAATPAPSTPSIGTQIDTTA